MSDPNHFEAGNLDVHEFRQILARRVKALADQSIDPSQPDEPIRQALDEVRESVPSYERNSIGFALSGGGIRSATFGLGVIQGLAELGLLKFVDYLSTVSGGGYIGGWLAAWIKREGNLENVSKQLRPKRTDQAEADRGFQDDPPRLKQGTVCDDEPEPIAHLREFSNYLSPKMSLFSADSWTLIAIYLRNLLANQLVLLPMVLALLMGVRALAAFFSWPALGSNWGLVLGVLSCVGLLACFWLITYSITLVSDRSASKTAGPATGPTWFFWTIALVFLESILLTWLLVPITNCEAPPVAPPCHWRLLVCQWAALIRPEHPVVFNGYQLLLLSAVFGSLHGAFNLLHWNFTRIAFGFASGAIAGTVLYLALHFVLWPNWQNPDVIITWGPPLMLLIITLANVLEAAFLGRQAEEQEREWRSRFNAWLMILAAGWTLIFALSLQGSQWLSLLNNSLKTGLTAGWITTALGGLLAGKSSKTDHKQGSPWLDRVSRLAPYVFLIGLVCVMSWLANALVAWRDQDFENFQQISQRDRACQQEQSRELASVHDHRRKEKSSEPQAQEIPSTPRRKESPPEAERDGQVTYRSTFELPDGDVKHEIIDEQHFVRESDAKVKRRERYSFDIQHPDWGWLWGSFGVSFIVAMLASWRVDVNEFSLNALYANRLMRCYLGASRRKPFTDVSGTPAHNHGPEWNPNRVTGFDPQDDVDLVKFRIGGPQTTSADCESADKEQSYWGPLPLINTALNLVSGDRLAWQERMAESFLLSPQFCGAKSLGYRDTEEYAAGHAKEKPLTLGRSVAISGAAANPNMGYHSSPAVTALMTLFNVRLGWWLPNPRKEDPNQKPEFIWRSRGPGFLLKWLAIELFSLTNSKRRYLNISDGGHFENLGVYELVRRRCRLIIVSDAGADPNFEFEDLGGLIRKCRTDFGVDIEIDVNQLRPDTATRKSKWHCVIGTIRYDHVEPAAPVGTLIYLKPSLSGDEPADLLHYAEQHADFPHQPTLDQFFNESQFESYRALGYHVAMQAFDDVARRIKKTIDVQIDGNDSEDLKCLFKKVCEAHDAKNQPQFDDVASQIQKAIAPHDVDRSKALKCLLKKVREAHNDLTENLVYALRKRWLAPLPDIDQDFLKSTESFTELQEAFRDKPELNAISRELYAEVALSHARGKNQVAELHTASLMLQVMENAWLTMHLESQHAHPLNAGWMNVFQRWTHSQTLQTHWPLLRNEYSRDFVFFCERETALKTEIGPLERLDASVVSDDQWQRICDEYWREWPKEFGRRRGVDRIQEEAVSYSTSDETPGVKALWVIRISPKKTGDEDQSTNSVVAGLVGVRKLANKAKLTFEELKAIEPGLQKKQKEHDQIQKEKEAFWELTDEELDTFAQQGIAPSRADLDSRLGYELVVWVRPGFRHLKVGQNLIEKFFEELDQHVPDSKLRKALGNGGRFKLAVYFPKSGTRPSEDKFVGVKSLWLTFFTFYGFRRPGKDTRRPDDNWPNILDDEILVWDSRRWT